MTLRPATIRLGARFVAVVGVLALGALAGCGDGGDGAAAAAGRYRLDQPHFARALMAERMAATKNAPPLTAAARSALQRACVTQARAVTLTLELRADGAFLARYAYGKTTQRLAGTWTQAGAVVSFATTSAPTGRVTTVPSVKAKQTAEGLLFGGDLSGWAVPHAFLMRPVP